MATNDYLRFSADSMKDLLTQHLNSSGVYTDQIYEDSDLSVLLDVFSFMYSVLTYQINQSGSEATFTDAQLYENLNRIVKMLGYNPRGFVTSTVAVSMGIEGILNNTGILSIPKYTTFTTSLTDGNGDLIKYTFVDNFAFVADSTSIDNDFIPVLYNGSWKLYRNLFVTTGIPFETYTLNEIELDGDDKQYLSHTHIDVYIKDENGTFTQYTPTTNLYNSLGTDNHFEIRINENKQYTLKFGDNINGKMPPSASDVYVVYLESNGKDGEIGPNVITGASLDVTIDGLNEAFIKTNILKVTENPEFVLFGTDPDAELQKITLTNSDASTIVNDLEDVSDIRTNAPVWFRIGGRLVTADDFRQYILTNYSSNIHDLKVMNNWEYMVDFQQWLKQYDKLSIDVKHYDYEYADSCDFNNVYLWLKSRGNDNVTASIKRIIERDVNRIKCLTSEIVPLDPFMLTVTPYYDGSYDLLDFDADHENTIEIVRDRNTMITVERIKQRVVQTIQDFFGVDNNVLGGTINIDTLYNSIMAIDGVKEVRTKYKLTGAAESTAVRFDGLSFAIWSQHLIQGADFTRISGNWKIKSFQFPFLLDSVNFSNKIEVLNDNYNISEIEY